MKYLCAILLFFVLGCSIQKPPLAPTQTVNGQSIIVPPEINVVPQIEPQNK